MKISLGFRIFLACLVVIFASAAVLAVATQFALPQAYGRHLALMEGMKAASNGMGPGMGLRQAQGEDAGSGLFAGFRSSFNEALIWAGLAAIVVALVVSVLVSRNLVAPINAMTLASQRISQGHYDERVQIKGGGELDNLAGSFNVMAEKLEQTETIRRQLIGDVSHELRTPLTAIQGSMEGLIDGILPATDETYTRIHQEAGRLSRLVDDLQELSRVESGAFQLEKTPVRFQTVVELATDRMSPQYNVKDVRLETRLSENLPDVLADEDRLGQVMLNLVGNALQYTPPGGQVVISAIPNGKELRVSVQDTGIGIPQAQLALIFDRFYRVDKSRSRSAGGGSGIGLTIVRRIVEAHGGEIRAESPGVGQGSTFTFSIPLA